MHLSTRSKVLSMASEGILHFGLRRRRNGSPEGYHESSEEKAVKVRSKSRGREREGQWQGKGITECDRALKRRVTLHMI